MLSVIRYSFPNIALADWIFTLKNAVKDCDSILDVGCGDHSDLQFVPASYKYGVDGYEPAIKKSKAQHIHHRYTLMDIRDLGRVFHAKTFDAVIAIDVIEHLPKEDSLTLLKQMESIAKKKVIIVTPNGYLPQIKLENTHQDHLCGWEPEELQMRGYHVTGLYGPKFLRGPAGALKYPPRIITGCLSEAIQLLYSHSHPKTAFSLFGVLCKRG